MKGLIFDIKRYAVHDGPGIRTTIFLKGCPLSCWWCHNPESQSTVQEKWYNKEKVGSSEFEVFEDIGKYYSISDLQKIFERESVFMEESGGGITISGGEPFMQTDFTLEVLKLAKEMGLHTAIDTTGYTSVENLNKVIPFTDLFLYDVKIINNDLHQKYTGTPSHRILKNLNYILDKGKKVIVRFPLIPGVNDDTVNIEEYIELLSGLKSKGLQEVNILPYHKLGISKHDKLKNEDHNNKFVEPDPRKVDQIKRQFELTGLKVKIGG